MLRPLTFGLLAIVSLASSACTIDVNGSGISQGATVREHKRIPLTGMANVTIRSFDGSIEVRSGASNEIVLDIERRAATLEDAKEIIVETKESDGNVLIEAKRPSHWGDSYVGRWPSPHVTLTVTVPPEVEVVDARTGDGAIVARDVRGRIDLRTGDGSVRLQGVQGEINVNTGDGAVTARDVAGKVAVNTGDGSVAMHGRFESLRAHTGDGAIDIDAMPGSSMREQWTITSGDGSVRVGLPDQFNADIEAHTGDGSISTTGVTVLNPDEKRDRRHVRGRIGNGGERLSVQTGDGSISVVAR